MQAIERAGRGGLRGHVERVYECNQERVPVDTGALKASGRIEEDRDSISIAYGHGDPETVDYGAIVHERERYAADPAFAESGQLEGDVARSIRQNIRRPTLFDFKD